MTRMIATLAVIVCGVLVSGSATAQNQRTVASAHEFLRTVMTRGTTQFNVVNSRTGYTSGYANIDTVTGNQCTTTVYGTATDGSSNTLSRRIDWTRVSFAGVNGTSSVGVTGAIEATNGDIIDGVTFTTESPELAGRIGEAMDFLRSNCDPTGNTGF